MYDKSSIYWAGSSIDSWCREKKSRSILY